MASNPYGFMATSADSGSGGRPRDPASGMNPRPPIDPNPSPSPNMGNPNLGGSTGPLGPYNPQLPRYRDNPGEQASVGAYGKSWADIYGPDLFAPGSYLDKNSPSARMVENTLPLAQFIQNAQQYGMDFNEAMRRWDAENARATAESNFGMGLQTRQQERAELETNRAWQIANMQFGLESELGRGNLANDRYGIDTQREIGLGANANDRMRIQNERALGDMANQIRQYEATTGRMDMEGRQALAQAQLALDRQLGMGQLEVQQEANSIESAYKVGLISNQQREIALAELAQRQQHQLDAQRLGLESELGRGRLGLDTTELQLNEAFRRAELAQQAKLARRQMENELLQSRYAAFGRAATPQGAWARQWA